MGKLLSICAAQACRPPSTSKIDFVLSFDFSILTAICESRPRRQIQMTKNRNKEIRNFQTNDELHKIFQVPLLLGSSPNCFNFSTVSRTQFVFFSKEFMWMFNEFDKWHISYSGFVRTSINKCGCWEARSWFNSSTVIRSVLSSRFTLAFFTQWKRLAKNFKIKL